MNEVNKADEVALIAYDIKMVRSILKNNASDMDLDTVRFCLKQLDKVLTLLEGN